MRDFFTSLLRDDAGQDLAEYALLIALIALVVIGAVTALGSNVSSVFNNIAGRLSGATGGGATE
jgi:pilus assembly protein Flp/PilA